MPGSAHLALPDALRPGLRPGLHPDVRLRHDTRCHAPPRVPPFASAEAAWFWTAASLRAQQEPGAPRPGPGPCRPEDVVKRLDTLYRNRRVELLHVRILRIWGWRGLAPNPAQARERCDWRLWHEAVGRLEWPLRVGGIVAGPVADALQDVVAEAVAEWGEP